jgi:hypothetical protein
MTAGVGWLLVGIGAIVIGLYVFVVIFASSRDRWPR